MRGKLLALSGLLLAVLSGCASETVPMRSATDQALFGSVSMHLHPVFTQVRDWNGDTRPDGVEALVELRDQFGDPTKASGTVIFELYEYKPLSPDPRGVRLVGPWEGRLDSIEDQRQHWSRPSRSYTFQLAYPKISASRSYVLTASFELTGGGRYFDQMILEGAAGKPDDAPKPAATQDAAHAPANQPPARSNTP